MSRTVRAAFAALFVSAALNLAASSGAPAETCLSAPNATAPEGSHWYYRTDRATKRKCWYLADKAEKEKAGRAARSSRGEAAREIAAGPERADRGPETPASPPPMADNADEPSPRSMSGAAAAGSAFASADATLQVGPETLAAPPAGVLPWPSQSVSRFDAAEAQAPVNMDRGAEPATNRAVSDAERNVVPPAPGSATQGAAGPATETRLAISRPMLLLLVAASAMLGGLLYAAVTLVLAHGGRVDVGRRASPSAADRYWRDFHAVPAVTAARREDLRDLPERAPPMPSRR